jgi:hypothetical protein
VELAILFWCYKEPQVCANKLRLLRHYNPTTPIYVLFGGEPAAAPQFQTEFDPFINDFYAFPEEKSPEWKWQRGDRLIARWFIDRGYGLNWDSIAIIQWDMLVFAPVEQLFSHLKKNELLLSGARSVEEVKTWWPWVQPWHPEYRDFLHDNDLAQHEAWCCEFIVAVFPRAFLERFAARKNPELGFLEYTIPSLAKSWGFDFCTDHPYTPWWNCDPAEFNRHPYDKMLNAIGEECPDRYVLLHLLDPWGLRIFHPYSRDLRTDSLSSALPAWLNFLRCNQWDYADLFGGSTRAMARQVIAGTDLVLSGPVTRHPAICLNMIVHNAAHALKTLLDAVAPYISSWAIVDTGSDDGTRELIVHHMAALGIPGELYERPWRDSGHNRSEALTLAQGHGDYIWVLDADDMLVGNPDFTRLGASIYWLRCITDNGDTFWRAQLFRDGLNVRYEGVTHDYVVQDGTPRVGMRLEGDYHIESRCLGGSNMDPQERFACDRDLLLGEVERNPEDSNSVFSLAHSYFALGEFANARDWYARRVEMGGWDEEVFFAMHRVAESMAQLAEPWPAVQDAYLRAWEYRPTRAEPLYAIAFRYRVEQRYQLGHLFARQAAQIPRPEADTLFVRTDVHDWLAADEQAICASHIGKHAEAFTLCRGLLARPDIPDAQRQRIAANRDFSVPAMIEAASPYPDALVRKLIACPRADEVTVSLIAGPDPNTTEQTLNSFLHCCTDVAKAGRFLILDPGLPASDRARLQQRYGFIEFADCQPDSPLTQIRSHIRARFWLHLSHGWRFFAPENFITRLTGVLDAEPQVFQVGINFADAIKLTGTCASEHVVRRTPDAGRYVLTDEIASGPAMFDTTRLDRATGLHAATLDEILCTTAA